MGRAEGLVGVARRRARALALLTAAAALGWLALALGWGGPRALPPPDNAPGPPFARRPGVKYILLWNKYFHYENLGFGPGRGRAPFVRAGCRQSQCFMTSERTLMPPQDFDAVVFHMYYFDLHFLPFLNWGKFPPARSSHQRYVFFLLESPANCGSSYRGMRHLFNWTMTYRLDSDVPAPYGELRPRAGVRAPERGWLPPPAARGPAPALALALAHGPEANALHASSSAVRRRGRVGRRVGEPGAVEPAAEPAEEPEAGTAAWLVSHCATQSQRERLVAQLSRHVQVHVFGDCGAPWPKDDLKGFYRMLTAKYKFYLSFENSLCKDYVTEKLFNILEWDIVPVVYGAANYSAVVPPHSYIDARAFATPRHLAAYLLYLVRHPDEYAKYFWWKRYYEVVPNPHSNLCRLCEKLHQPSPPKSYADMEEWWNGEGVCQKPDVSLEDIGG